MITGNLTAKNSLLSELPMNFIRTSNEKRLFLSELPMKNGGHTTVYHSIPHSAGGTLDATRRAVALQRKKGVGV